MASSLETEEARNEIFSWLLEVFEGLDRMTNSFIAAKQDEARWVGVLAGGLVLIFLGILGVPLINIAYHEYLGENPSISLFLMLLVAALSFFTGFLAYVYARKRYTRIFVSWKDIIQQLRKAVTEHSRKDVNVIEKTLQLMDQMSDWLPKLLNYKNDEAVAYGFGAFLLVAFISLAFELMPLGLLFALLIGAIVWIYFRYEKRKEADQQIREFKSWKQKFEEGKASFLETM
jgi:O-antigen/teichoic acid export membrane protein